MDSGVGGLTVVRAILDQLPNEPVVYVGDTAHGPYGPRPIGYGPDDAELKNPDEKPKDTVWIPILEGLTNDEYCI
jgi:hypothetical protein